MIIDLLFKHQAQLAADVPAFRTVMEQVNDPANLALIQALLLAAAVYELQPKSILDLGTGMGNSSAVFGLIADRFGAEVHTFDINPNWPSVLANLREPFRAKIAANVTAHGDITACGFEDLVGDAPSVVVFWDAHGFEVAQHVLSTIMPLIADRAHLVLCHDMSDNRYAVPKSYGGMPIWGIDAQPTAYVNASWVCSHAAQAIAILDFCWRNDLSFHSIDEELRERVEPARRNAFLQAVALNETSAAHMGYFTMMETQSRNFPGRVLAAPVLDVPGRYS